jgi:uncharacterized repeat protein (TIGR02543 family)
MKRVMIGLLSMSLITLLMGLSGCSNPTGSPRINNTSTPTSRSILDAAHGDGGSGFYFLPPMVPQPAYSGTFDDSLSPIVQIWPEGGELPIAIFSSATGPGSETVRMVPEDEHYIVNWHVGDFDLDPAVGYQIRVLVDDRELGHADVVIVSNGSELKYVNTEQYIGLLEKRTLPIKFRIEVRDQPATYTVTYDGNGSTGGDVPVDPNTYSPGQTVTVLGSGSLVKTGFTFAGWNTEANGAGSFYTEGQTFLMGPANVTLYAQWTANSYTITFDKNDAAAAGTMASQTMPSGSSANLAANTFTKAGWTFAGWATTPTGAVAYANGASYVMGTADVTLYAKWALTQVITFEFDSPGIHPCPFTSVDSLYARFSDSYDSTLFIVPPSLYAEYGCHSGALASDYNSGSTVNSLIIDFDLRVTSLSLEFGNDDEILAILRAYDGATTVGQVTVTSNSNGAVDQTIGITVAGGFTSATFTYADASGNPIAGSNEVIDYIWFSGIN